MVFVYLLWKSATISMSIRDIKPEDWRDSHEQSKVRAARYESIGTKMAVICITIFLLSLLFAAVAQANADSSLAAIEAIRIIGECDANAWCQQALVDHVFYANLCSIISMVCKVLALVAFIL